MNDPTKKPARSPQQIQAEALAEAKARALTPRPCRTCLFLRRMVGIGSGQRTPRG